jgi:hypothetical protein
MSRPLIVWSLNLLGYIEEPITTPSLYWCFRKWYCALRDVGVPESKTISTSYFVRVGAWEVCTPLPPTPSVPIYMYFRSSKIVPQ